MTYDQWKADDPNDRWLGHELESEEPQAEDYPQTISEIGFLYGLNTEPDSLEKWKENMRYPREGEHDPFGGEPSGSASAGGGET